MDQGAIDRYEQQEHARQDEGINYNIFNFNMYNIILLLYDTSYGSWKKR